MQKYIRLFLLTLCSLSLANCAALPGGKEPSEAEINQMAAKSYREVKAKSKISRNPRWNALLDKVASRIARASGKNYQWEWVLIESPQLNAWCMPGGKMAVYTGILPVLQTEAALAAVLGHEVAHATLQHGRKGYARAIKEKYAGLLLGGASIIGGQLFCKTKKCKTLTAVGGAAAGFALTFFNRKFSRSNEVEADRYGQIYMARAGYDPSEAIRVWERMNRANNGKAPPEFLSTHPSNRRRQDNLRAWLPEANRHYQKSAQQYGIGVRL